LLLDHFGALSLPAGSRVFVPLCGKTRDILWLLESGYRVVGVELSRMAVEQLFAEMDLQPAISQVGPLTRFAVEDIDIYCGDIFELTGSELGPVDAVYDRAALVALPANMRQRYAEHLAAITGRARQLLIAYEYDQSLQDGPPFAVSADEVRRLYGRHYEPVLLASSEVAGGLRGNCPANEHVWLLRQA
jgi:thiopurine S-methyltransferase